MNEEILFIFAGCLSSKQHGQNIKGNTQKLTGVRLKYEPGACGQQIETMENPEALKISGHIW